jgi:hypothetical protein
VDDALGEVLELNAPPLVRLAHRLVRPRRQQPDVALGRQLLLPPPLLEAASGARRGPVHADAAAASGRALPGRARCGGSPCDRAVRRRAGTIELLPDDSEDPRVDAVDAAEAAATRRDDVAPPLLVKVCTAAGRTYYTSRSLLNVNSHAVCYSSNAPPLCLTADFSQQSALHMPRGWAKLEVASGAEVTTCNCREEKTRLFFLLLGREKTACEKISKQQQRTKELIPRLLLQGCPALAYFLKGVQHSILQSAARISTANHSSCQTSPGAFRRFHCRAR